MQRAKAVVNDIMHKNDHHDTKVHEKVAPAVVHEEIEPQVINETQVAIDREVHQDHFHTSVQPIKDREVLPETHTHKVAGVEHKEIRHGDNSHVQERLAREQAQFADKRTVAPTVQSSATAPVVAGEHVHHHVHETIQPVVQKETIQPTVVHTTVPIHEVHHNEAKHHTSSALPTVSLEQFKAQGGSLTGREERTDGFEGAPKAVAGAVETHKPIGGPGARGDTSLTDPHGSSSHHVPGTHTGSGHHTGTTNPLYSSTHGTTQPKKPSLMDKLNPNKDADGDGVAGFMK